MANTNPQPLGSSAPPKPWERVGSSSGPAPFKPSSPGSTSDVVEGYGTANPGEVVSNSNKSSAAVNAVNTLGRPVPARPWEQQTYGNSYGGYRFGMNYNSSSYGTGTYGGTYGGSYGGGMYGNSMYRGGYSGLYGGSGGMYGGGMYGGGGVGGMGGYGGVGGMGSYGGVGGMGGYGGMGMGGGPYGEQDPNNPFGAPSAPPNFWISLMRVMHGVVNFFGRFAMLIDQNTQAFHMFMSALLQLFDRSGLVYGEIARFVLRLLGVKRKPKQGHPPGLPGLPGSQNPHAGQNYLEGPKAAPSGGWDNVWGGN